MLLRCEKQKLWSQDDPETLRERIDDIAGSTRQVRFEHEDVEKENAELARQPLQNRSQSIQSRLIHRVIKV